VRSHCRCGPGKGWRGRGSSLGAPEQSTPLTQWLSPSGGPKAKTTCQRNPTAHGLWLGKVYRKSGFSMDTVMDLGTQ
jgi:hypothetical protein